MRSFPALATLCCLALLAALPTGCANDKKKPAATPSAKVVADAKTQAVVSYAEIDTLIARAKTSDDFLDIIIKCGELQIEASMAGNGKLSEDPTYREKCELAPEKARAERVVAHSTPDSPSVMCITAAMNLEELIERGRAPREFSPLLGKVNEACGI